MNGTDSHLPPNRHPLNTFVRIRDRRFEYGCSGLGMYKYWITAVRGE